MTRCGQASRATHAYAHYTCATASLRYGSVWSSVHRSHSQPRVERERIAQRSSVARAVAAGRSPPSSPRCHLSAHRCARPRNVAATCRRHHRAADTICTYLLPTRSHGPRGPLHAPSAQRVADTPTHPTTASNDSAIENGDDAGPATPPRPAGALAALLQVSARVVSDF